MSPSTMIYRNFGRDIRFLYRPYRVNKSTQEYGTVTVCTVTTGHRLYHRRNHNQAARSPMDSHLLSLPVILILKS